MSKATASGISSRFGRALFATVWYANRYKCLFLFICKLVPRQKTQPASFDMMLQLPPPQLKDFLSAKVAESIRKPFRDHLQPEAAKPRVIPILQHLDSLLKPETVGDQ